VPTKRGAKNKRIFESIAVEELRKVGEGNRHAASADDFDAEEKRERAARKLLAASCARLSANAFKSPRFEPAWKTSTVVALAQGIFEGGHTPDARSWRTPARRRCDEEAGCGIAAARI